MCTINIGISEPIENLIDKAKQGITSVNGASFAGDIEKGDFTIPTPVGKIKGNYTVIDGSIQFQITDKPMFIGCERIESELRKYLSPATT